MREICDLAEKYGAMVMVDAAALDLVASSDAARSTLRDNTALFRRRMAEAGFDILPDDHPAQSDFFITIRWWM